MVFVLREGATGVATQHLLIILWQAISLWLWGRRDLNSPLAKPPVASPSRLLMRRPPPANPVLLAAAVEAVFGSPDLCAAVLLRYGSSSHLRVAKVILATSSVCHSWRLSVNSARLWKALCLQRWPSTMMLPLPPMVDYCHYFQSRTLAQAERHRLTPSDVFFLLEIRSRFSGEVVLSKALCLGQATVDARGPGYCWLLPEMSLWFEASWSLDGSGFYRRTDGRMHHLDFKLCPRSGDAFEWPGDDEHWDDTDYHSDGDSDGDGDGDGDGEESEDGELDDFIDDGNNDGGAQEGDEGEEGEEEGEEGEEAGEEGEEGEDEDEEEGWEEEVAEKPPKRRRAIIESDEDESNDDEGDEGGARRTVPQCDGAGDEEGDEEEAEEAAVVAAAVEEEEVVEQGGSTDEEDNYTLSESARGLDADGIDMNLLIGFATLDYPQCDDDDDEASLARRCYIAFESSAEYDNVPKLILQFQSNTPDDGDGWEPERAWVGSYGHAAGVWAILDDLRWG